MRNAVPRIVAALTLVCLLVVPVFAALTGDIEGTVLDAAGAAVLGAKVTIKSVSTGATRTVRHDGESKREGAQGCQGHRKARRGRRERWISSSGPGLSSRERRAVR